MPIQFVLLPLFVQVALTFVLLFWMGRSRLGAIKRKETRITDVALGQPYPNPWLLTLFAIGALVMRAAGNPARGYYREVFAFSPMFTIGIKQAVKGTGELRTWLKVEKAS